MFVVLASLLCIVSSCTFVHSNPIDNDDNSVDSANANYETNDFIEHDIDNRHSKNGSRMIFPGTKWCGPGNSADNYEDLGVFEDTDKCCRAHDHCDGIEAGGSKYGITNDTPFTKLHCGCDKAFYKCLRQVDQTQSDILGEIYFSANEKCYKKAYPIIECEEHIHFLWMKRCSKYKVDVTKPKQYQFFDLPFWDTVEQVEENLMTKRSACQKRQGAGVTAVAKK